VWKNCANLSDDADGLAIADAVASSDRGNRFGRSDLIEFFLDQAVT
jgi:hypothetical protein